METVAYYSIHCPYCGEPIELLVDASSGAQEYIEDCSVCCRPIEVRLSHDGGEWAVAVHRDDD